MSNIYLKLRLNLNDLVTCIIFDTFVSFLICLIISDMHLQKSLYIQSSQVQAYVLVKPGGHWFIYQKTFIILVNTLIFLKDKTNACIREKF